MPKLFPEWQIKLLVFFFYANHVTCFQVTFWPFLEPSFLQRHSGCKHGKQRHTACTMEPGELTPHKVKVGVVINHGNSEVHVVLILKLTCVLNSTVS